MTATGRQRMNVVELHPEELLDVEARGKLTLAEAAVLDAHCARCAVCRYERVMRCEFASALDREDEDALVIDETLQNEGDRESGHVYSSPRQTPPREAWWFGRKVVGWMSVAGTLVLGSHYLGQLGPNEGHASQSTHARAAATERTPIDVSSTRARVSLPEEPMTVARAVARVDIVTSAAALFDDANRARVRGEYPRALERYQALQRRYPTSREASMSYVTMGRMQLDRADAAGALASFARYAEVGDVELDAVVMAGRALALDELGSASAPLAWAALLDTHPDTPYAEHARLRAAARSL